VQIDYVGRNMQISEDIRAFTERKLGKATRFLDEPVEVRVILETEGHRHIAEIHVHHRFGDLQAVEETKDLKDSILDAVDKIRKQARRGRKKFLDKRRRGDRRVASEWPLEIVARDSIGNDGDAGSASAPRVVQSTALSIKPMSLDEAALRLETAKNDFLVFRDSDHGRVNVLYKRQDGDYGLITPEG
jgi:putative sigma-54 modulation protein